jgi:hypothetical protein
MLRLSLLLVAVSLALCPIGRADRAGDTIKAHTNAYWKQHGSGWRITTIHCHPVMLAKKPSFKCLVHTQDFSLKPSPVSCSRVWVTLMLDWIKGFNIVCPEA